jgi:hypothetical protein
MSICTIWIRVDLYPWLDMCFVYLVFVTVNVFSIIAMHASELQAIFAEYLLAYLVSYFVVFVNGRKI